MVNIPKWPLIRFWQPGRKTSLEQTLKVLDKLGNPQDKLPPIIHVAGTNGKGSSVAMLRSIYMQAAYKVDSYTSPHLIEFNERINLNGQAITDYHLNDVLLEAKQACDALGYEPGFFEGTTIAAFLAFSRSDADILILETGLGGRLDCTNVVKKPLATLITPISYDHMEYLGNDILKIATEKAGIIKNNVPCIIGKQTDEVAEFLIDKCANKSAPSFCYEYDFGIEKMENGFIYKSRDNELTLPQPSLPGDHQLLNAAAVIATTSLTHKDFKINKQHIIDGLKDIYWPGRLQKIQQDATEKLLGNEFEIYLDGAHNESGAISLSAWLAQNKQDYHIYMILGMTRNRNAKAFCSHFSGVIKQGYAVNVQSEPSSYNANALQALASSESGINFKAADDIQTALQQIKSGSASNKKKLVIVTGSLFLISDFLIMKETTW